MTRFSRLFLVSASLIASLIASADGWAQEEPHAVSDAGTGFRVKLDAGPAYRDLLGHGIGAADVRLAIGGETRSAGAFYGAGSLLVGQTDDGLATKIAGLGPSWELPFGPVRVGLLLEGKYLVVTRFTRDATMRSLGGTLTGFGTVDFMGGRALTLTAGLDVEGGAIGDYALFGASLKIGARFALF